MEIQGKTPGRGATPGLVAPATEAKPRRSSRFKPTKRSLPIISSYRYTTPAARGAAPGLSPVAPTPADDEDTTDTETETEVQIQTPKVQQPQFLAQSFKDGARLSTPSSRVMNGLGEINPTFSVMERPKPEEGMSSLLRAWTRARSITFGFYEWPPHAESFRFFCKRGGVMLGTEVEVSASQLDMPPNYISPKNNDPTYAGAKYIEYTLEGLKPNSRYIIKVTPVGVGKKRKGIKRSMFTISDEEQSKRDTYMSRFVGVMAVVTEKDAAVAKFDPATGQFLMQLMEAQDTGQPMLMRFESEYSEEGHNSWCYTKSNIYFSRWGGELRASSTLSARDISERGAQAHGAGAATRAEREYALKEKLLKREQKDLRHKMLDERKAVDEERRVWQKALVVTVGLCSAVALVLLVWLYLSGRAEVKQRDALLTSLADQLVALRANCSASMNLTDAEQQLLAAQAKVPGTPLGEGNSIAEPMGEQKWKLWGQRSSTEAPAVPDGPSGMFFAPDKLENQLRTLTELYQSQVLLRMQKLIDPSSEPKGP